MKTRATTHWAAVVAVLSTVLSAAAPLPAAGAEQTLVLSQGWNLVSPWVTPEPAARMGRIKNKGLQFVIQKHRASRLHYDFRLEHQGVMLSWAVPKGPSVDSSVKRLAMQTVDHPIEYNQFEGVIPEGEYGAGTVMIWDKGTWEPEVEDVERALQKGDLKFQLYGRKLRGSWVLVRIRDRQW